MFQAASVRYHRDFGECSNFRSSFVIARKQRFRFFKITICPSDVACSEIRNPPNAKKRTRSAHLRESRPFRFQFLSRKFQIVRAWKLNIFGTDFCTVNLLRRIAENVRQPELRL